MKLKNKLLPIVALSGIATVAMPLVTSCNMGGDTPKVEVEWNEEYGSFLEIFTDINRSGIHYKQVKWNFPKAIMSEEINKNIDNYNVYFIDTKTGELSEYINQKASYITSNPTESEYVDLHISCEDISWMEYEEWDEVDWSVTIKVLRKGSQDVVFSKPIYLGVVVDNVDAWNPDVEKTVSFDPTTGNYSCDNAIVVPSNQDYWSYTWLFDLKSGEIRKYIGDESDPYPFVLSQTVGDNNIYNFSGQWDRLQGVHEPVILSFEARCSTPAWDQVTNVRVQDITFVPQE